MTDDAIAPVAVEHDAAATLSVPRLIGERFGDGAVDDTIANQTALLLPRALWCYGRQRKRQHHTPNRALPEPVSAMIQPASFFPSPQVRVWRIWALPDLGPLPEAQGPMGRTRCL